MPSSSPAAHRYSPDMAVERLESLLRDAFPDAPELRVEDRTGGGDHFQVTVESPRFDGLSLLEQHRLVNDALAEPLRDGTAGSLADVIGSLQDRDLLERVFRDADALHEDVAAAMQPPLATIDSSASVDEIVAALTGGTNAVVVAHHGRPTGVVTRSDLLEYLAHSR